MKNRIFFGLLVLLVSAAGRAQGLFPSPFADDRAACFAFTNEVSSAQQGVIDELMGSVGHRQFHWLWHATRGGWDRLGTAEQTALRQMSGEWGRHARLCPHPGTAGAPSNPAGEEFLLMHHLMIEQLRQTLAGRGLPCIAPWVTIPDADDPVWPVPADPGDPSKNDRVGYLIRSWSEWFMSPDYLRGRSLSQVGFELEFTIHNNMHMRWAAPAAMTGGFAGFVEANQGVFSLVTTSDFADPRFNWLGHPYSSQVNPVFWKLHGWVDQVVARWILVNGYTRISYACPPGEATCYPWQSRWTGVSAEPTGGGAHDHGHANARTDSSALRQALEKIAPLGSFRNEAFEAALREPRGGAVPGGPVAMPEEDPAEFIRLYGPRCD